METQEIAPGKTFEFAIALGTLEDMLKDFKRKVIILVLKMYDGNRSKTAKFLDIQRTYLSRLLGKDKLDITDSDWQNHEPSRVELETIFLGREKEIELLRSISGDFASLAETITANSSFKVPLPVGSLAEEDKSKT